MVGIESEPAFTPGSPQLLFAGSYVRSADRNSDISPDGQRFMMLKGGEQSEETSARTELIIVQNWFEELKRLVPTN